MDTNKGSIVVGIGDRQPTVKYQEHDMRGHGLDVTVGFDGSPASCEALHWVADRVAGPSTFIHVVGAFSVASDESEATARSHAERKLDESLSLLGDQDHVDRVARLGDPVEVLLQCSSATDLLVVGRHGTSQLIHNAMGSVSDACAHLADCPVVVVPPPIPSGN